MAKRTKATRPTKTPKARPGARLSRRRWAGVPPAAHHDDAAPGHDARARQLPTGDRDDDPSRDGLAEARLADLGPIVLPSAEDSRRVLRELATLYHERFDAQRRHDTLKTELKAAAEAIAGLTTRLAERLRAATHRTGLPLFTDADADLAEDDGGHP